MLIPRFSLRYLLGLMTASGIFFLLVTFAVRGQPWATAVAVAIGSLAVGAVLHAVVFVVAYALALMARTIRRSEIPKSPFATSRPPPQVIPSSSSE